MGDRLEGRPQKIEGRVVRAFLVHQLLLLGILIADQVRADISIGNRVGRIQMVLFLVLTALRCLPFFEVVDLLVLGSEMADRFGLSGLVRLFRPASCLGGRLPVDGNVS